MTSGGAVHYKSMFDAGSQIVAKEGTKSLFKGAGANILRGVAGAGVLSLYDKLQELMFGKVYSVRRRLLQSRPKVDMGSRVVPVKRVPDVYTSTTRNPSTYRSSTSSPFSRCYRFIHPLQCLFYPHDLLLDLFSLASAVRMWLRKLDMQNVGYAEIISPRTSRSRSRGSGLAASCHLRRIRGAISRKPKVHSASYREICHKKFEPFLMSKSITRVSFIVT
jgi:hypothetical protein